MSTTWKRTSTTDAICWPPRDDDELIASACSVLGNKVSRVYVRIDGGSGSWRWRDDGACLVHCAHLPANEIIFSSAFALSSARPGYPRPPSSYAATTHPPEVGMTKFGDFETLCHQVPSYPWCNLFYRQVRSFLFIMSCLLNSRILDVALLRSNITTLLFSLVYQQPPPPHQLVSTRNAASLALAMTAHLPTSPTSLRAPSA